MLGEGAGLRCWGGEMDWPKRRRKSGRKSEREWGLRRGFCSGDGRSMLRTVEYVGVGDGRAESVDRRCPVEYAVDR